MFDSVYIKSMSRQIFEISLICIFDLFFYINFEGQFDVFSPLLENIQYNETII